MEWNKYLGAREHTPYNLNLKMKGNCGVIIGFDFWEVHLKRCKT